MDTVMIGKFLKELRKEKGYTQETLGEKIGVTNKTVSRWETGTYMPPVECLVMLSDIYDVSINEIVAGQRLSQSEFNDKAEENLSEALRLSENEYKQREKKLTIVMAVSMIIAMVLIWLVPFNKEDMARSIVIILLIICLVFISNTLNVIALAQNKEKHEKSISNFRIGQACGIDSKNCFRQFTRISGCVGTKKCSFSAGILRAVCV